MGQQIEKFIPATQSIIYDALKTSLTKDLEDTVIMPILKKAVIQAYFDLSFKQPTQAEFDLLIAGVIRNIRLENFNIRIAEIPIAISRGILGKYGEFMGLSVVSFTNFVKEYCKNDMDRLLALTYHNTPDEVKKEPTPDEMRIQFLNRLNGLFVIFKDQGHIRPHEGAYYFDRLYKEKIIVFDEKLRQELKERALKDVFDKSQKVGRNPDEQKIIKNRLNEITANGFDDTEVLMLAKYFGLITWFEFLVETETNINDLIE